MFKLGVATLCASVLAVAVRAEAPGPKLDTPLEVGAAKPDWAVKPSAAQVSRAYPRLARMLALSGRAEIRCTAEPDGAADGCHVSTESPTGLGFGVAALRLAPEFRMRPGTVDGRPTGSAITIPFHFVPEAELKKPAGTDLPPASPAALGLANEILDLSGSEEVMRAHTRASLDTLISSAVEAGDGRPGPAVLDAFESSLDKVGRDALERRAHTLASTVSLATLMAVRDFLKTNAGQEWISFGRTETAREDNTVAGRQMVWLAREHYCAKTAC